MTKPDALATSPAGRAAHPVTLGRWATLASVGPGVLAATVFTLCLALRSLSLLTLPRFWAEEGPVYYAPMQHLSLARAMTYVANGNYQFATNLAVELSLLGKPRDAAAVTTAVALLVAILCCVLIARFMAAQSCSRVSIAVASALFALQVPGYEVFLNATNLQWVCSVATLFLILAPDIPAASVGAFARYLAVAALGLTGVTSCMLLPAAAAVAAERQLSRRRPRRRPDGTRTRAMPGRRSLAESDGAPARRSLVSVVVLAVLAAATLAQAAVILTHQGNDGRAYSVSVASLIPLSFQGVLTAVLPPTALDAVGAAVLAPDRFAKAIGVQMVVIGLALLGVVAAGAAETIGRFRIAVLLATAVCATLLNEFGALGGLGDLTSSYGGSRYFFLASTCTLVLLAAGLSSRSPWRRRCTGVAVVVVASNLILTATASPLPTIFFKGRPFAAQVDACAAAAPCPVFAWPDTDWTRFEIDPPRRP